MVDNSELIQRPVVISGDDMAVAMLRAHNGQTRPYTQAEIDALDPAVYGVGSLERDDGVRFWCDGVTFTQRTSEGRLTGSGVPTIRFDSIVNFDINDPETGAITDDIDTNIGDWGSIKIDEVTAVTGTILADNVYLDMSVDDGFWISYFASGHTTRPRFAIFTDETVGFSGTNGRFFWNNVFTDYNQGWNILFIKKADFVAQGTPDWNNPVLSLRMDFLGDAVEPWWLRVEGIWLKQSLQSKGRLVLGFDDSHHSTFQAHALAKKYSVPLTHWVIPQFLDGVDTLTSSEVLELQSGGDSICMHDFVSFDTYTTYQEAKNAIDEVFNNFALKWITPHPHFAWPGGYFGQLSSGLQDDMSPTGRIALFENAMVDAGVLSARTTGSFDKDISGFSEKYKIGAVVDLDSAVSIADVISHIDDCISNGTTIFINAHHLGTPDSLTWSLADFTELLVYVHRKTVEGVLDATQHHKIL